MTPRHPYRTPLASGGPRGLDRLEERAVALVLLVAGLVALASGLRAPNESAAELVLGVALAGLGLWTGARAHR